MLIGMEKGQSIIEQMDTSEIKAVVSEIQSLAAVSQEIQKDVWSEFLQLGYNDNMKSSEVLTIIRFLFNGSKVKR